MKLIIAEKPDQGLKIAAPFSFKKKDGYVEIQPCLQFPQGAYLTWAIGHLCELVAPEVYDEKWKKWNISTLPMIPTRFMHVVSKGKYKQFAIIKQLVHDSKVSEIIMAGDCEREGEHIVRLILSVSGNTKPTKRLWISSLTENAVLKGFENLLEEEETRNIYFEAYSRACADWLVGMNASRVYTLLLQHAGIHDVFSVGRVQTPTLALIVKREKEIASFVSEPFWEVFAKFKMDSHLYEGKWHKDNDSRITSEEMAKKIAAFCEGKEAVVTDVEKERKEFQPPFLYNLSSLQGDANKRYKMSPQKTLDTAQKLYVKGIISYPRSDSSFVTKEEAQGFELILEKIKQIPVYAPFFPLAKETIINDKRYVNEKKVTDHYAIIPTEQVPNISKLTTEEQQIYDLIVRSLLAAHCEKAIFDYTTIHTVVEGRATFVSKGKVKVQDGWRRVKYINEKEEEKEAVLPPIEKDQSGIVKSVKVKSGKTQPPKRYTEGQLIAVMKTAGKHVEDESLMKVLNRTEGLGTEATRAGIINVLKQRKYIDVKKNQVFATEKGMLLIDAIGAQLLASPEMTAKWEQRLHEIGEGTATASNFMEQVKKLTAKIIEDAQKEAVTWDFNAYNIEQISKQSSLSKGTYKERKKVGKCMQCGGDMIDMGKFYGCANYGNKKCTFSISKKILGKTISQKNVRLLLKGEPTEVIKGFKKDDNVFDAKVKWNDGKLSFIYEKQQKNE
ncbi:MAG: DNA topoisomerase III [Bacillaceae bacterium]